jgi:GTP pyrophosphokinase
VNILGCTAVSGDDQVSVMHFEFELGDPSHLGALLASVRRVPSVFEVEREMPRLADNSVPSSG